MDLSIIVPVYNVEDYIRPCIKSIFRQGLDDNCFEVIIVNDGTEDRSIEVIQDIVKQHQNITILNQENQGLSVARNNGIAMAKGEYILMPDSDDLLIENSLKPLLEKAIEYESDLVVADFLSLTDDEIELLQLQPIKQNTILTCIEKTGEQLLLEDLNPNQCYVWRTLFKKDFLIKNNIKFVPGIYIQDVPFTHECYIKAQKCLRVSWLLNIYRRGHESATFSFNKKKELDFCTAIAKTWELMNIEGLSPNIQGKLREDIYISFSMVIWILIHRTEKASDRIEIIDYLRSQAPDLCFTNGIKQIIVSFFYRYLPHTFIRIRFLFDHWLRRPF